MEIKTFKEKQKEKLENAKFIIETAKKTETVIPELVDLKDVVKNPYESTKKDVKDIANMAAEIYDIGLDAENPAVRNWAKQELGISSKDFGEILDNADTKDEVKKNILVEMEAPKEIIEEVVNNNVEHKTK